MDLTDWWNRKNINYYFLGGWDFFYGTVNASFIDILVWHWPWTGSCQRHYLKLIFQALHPGVMAPDLLAFASLSRNRVQHPFRFGFSWFFDEIWSTSAAGPIMLSYIAKEAEESQWGDESSFPWSFDSHGFIVLNGGSPRYVISTEWRKLFY